MLLFKMMSVVGRVLAYLTFDMVYKQRRNHMITKSVKSLGTGIMQAFKLLIFSLLYIFKQFYIVPVRMYSQSKYFGIFLSIFIVIFLN